MITAVICEKTLMRLLLTFVPKWELMKISRKKLEMKYIEKTHQKKKKNQIKTHKN